MTVALVSRVAIAISMGAVLATNTHAVGPCWRPDKSIGWAVLNLDGDVLVATHEFYEATGVYHNGQVAHTTRYDLDWSSFGAARTFVDAVAKERGGQGELCAIVRRPAGRMRRAA